jgi:hypothetical protein
MYHGGGGVKTIQLHIKVEKNTKKRLFFCHFFDFFDFAHVKKTHFFDFLSLSEKRRFLTFFRVKIAIFLVGVADI